MQSGIAKQLKREEPSTAILTCGICLLSLYYNAPKRALLFPEGPLGSLVRLPSQALCSISPLNLLSSLSTSSFGTPFGYLQVELFY